MRALEERLNLLERENAAAALEIERLGEAQRFLSKAVQEQAGTRGSIAGGK